MATSPMDGVGLTKMVAVLLVVGESGGWATALQKGVARGEGVLECGGLTPLWVGARAFLSPKSESAFHRT